MTEGISDVSWWKHLFSRKTKRASENCVAVCEIVYVEEAMALTFMNEASEGFPRMQNLFHESSQGFPEIFHPSPLLLTIAKFAFTKLR